jgi:hypothetical protein
MTAIEPYQLNDRYLVDDGTVFLTGIQALARLPFGYAKVRRVERKLPAEYTAALEAVFVSLSAENLSRALHIADLPDMVRGYKDIKLANVKKFRAALESQLRQFN